MVCTGSGTACNAEDGVLRGTWDGNKSKEGEGVKIGGGAEITLAKAETKALEGVISTAPAHLMYSGCLGEYVVAIALQGRVPCKILGNVVKGDIMISAGGGYAKSCGSLEPKAGQIIGKALENFHGSVGEIEIMVGRY